MQQGGVQEQHIGHVTFDGTKLYVITTAFDPGLQTGKFEKLENFFEHLWIYLESVIGNRIKAITYYPPT
jgi:hypothetical protein